MYAFARLHALALSIALLVPALAHAAVTYEIENTSHRDWGCHDPCACPEMRADVKGSFILVPRPPDPLFANYDLTEIDFVTLAGASAQHWKGRGHYRIGGELAMSHQLVLDLFVDNDPTPHHYDSGLISGGSQFPRISIAAAAETVVCFHDVWQIDAKPANATAPTQQSLEQANARPNPFTESTEIEYTLAWPTRVRIQILDLAGRNVRTLQEATTGPGTHRTEWDGRTDNGAHAKPGLYTATIQTGTNQKALRLVRIE